MRGLVWYSCWTKGSSMAQILHKCVHCLLLKWTHPFSTKRYLVNFFLAEASHPFFKEHRNRRKSAHIVSVDINIQDLVLYTKALTRQFGSEQLNRHQSQTLLFSRWEMRAPKALLSRPDETLPPRTEIALEPTMHTITNLSHWASMRGTHMKSVAITSYDVINDSTFRQLSQEL